MRSGKSLTIGAGRTREKCLILDLYVPPAPTGGKVTRRMETPMTITRYADSTYLRTSTMWDVYSGGAAMCSDGIVRTLKRISPTADTFFSIPAAVSVRGKTVSGYVSITDLTDPNGNGTANDDKSTVTFHATGKHRDYIGEPKSRTFYIAYFGQGFPGEQAFQVSRYPSIAKLTEGFRSFASAVGRDYYDPYGTACATVYACDSEESWTEAECFADIGCPFDYPDFILGIGKRGGTTREAC